MKRPEMIVTHEQYPGRRFLVVGLQELAELPPLDPAVEGRPSWSDAPLLGAYSEPRPAMAAASAHALTGAFVSVAVVEVQMVFRRREFKG